MPKETETNSRLARWSERKLAHAPAVSEAPVPESADSQVGSQVDSQANARADDTPEDLDLPDIESLTGESDFTAFMKEGVPEDLKNLALRKLWRSDPVYANLDGLNDYDPEHVTFLVQAAEVAKEMLGKALKGGEGGGVDAADGGGDTTESSDAESPADADADMDTAAEETPVGGGRA
tara:strand:+ start:6882 stop:7415 length:534 start_codon:yes stop_codon:yes gene_type:complete